MPGHQLSSPLIRLFLMSRVVARHAFIFALRRVQCESARHGRAVKPGHKAPPHRASPPRTPPAFVIPARPGKAWTCGLRLPAVRCRPPAGGLDSNPQFLAAALAALGGDAYRVRASPSLENEGSLRDTDG